LYLYFPDVLLVMLITELMQSLIRPSMHKNKAL